MKNLKWACAQPLVGGMAIAAYQLLQTPPEFIITGFAGNDQELINYFKKLGFDVPVITMDPEYKYFMTEKDENLFNQYNKNINIMNYVPICSGLSALTTNCSKCKVDNPQNDNQYNLTNFILEKIKPDVAVYENAPGLYTDSGREVLENIRNIAVDHSYALTVEKTDTFKHGIPQHRQRTFAYFFNTEKAHYLQYENKKPKDLIPYLEEIPEWAEGQDVYAGERTDHKDVNYEFIESLCRKDESIPEMMGRYDNSIGNFSGYEFVQQYVGWDIAIEWAENKVIETNEEKKYVKELKNYRRMKEKTKENGRYWDDSCRIGESLPYVNAVIWKVMKQQKHPTEDRAINIREYAHLMGMPHDFNLSTWDEWVKISQNVPVATSRHVADNCIKYVNSELLPSSGKFMKQNNIKQMVDFVQKEYESIEEW